MKKTITAVLAALFVTAVFCETYPARPIRLIVPYAAGGGTDTAARPVAQKMDELGGQSAWIDNKAGGNSIIGVDAAAKAKADGYTALLFDDAVLVNNLIDPKIPYNPKDLVPVAPLVNVPLMLVVSPQLKVNSVQELVDLAKKKLGSLNYVSPGATGMGAMAMEYFAKTADIKLTPIPYRGLAAGLMALSVDESQVAVVGFTTGIEQVKAGRIRAIAVLSKERIRQLPAVPAVAEMYPSFEISAFNGFMVPAKTPPEVIVKLNELILRAEADPDIRQRQLATGAESWVASPAEFQAYVAAKTKFWEGLIKHLRTKAEQ